MKVPLRLLRDVGGTCTQKEFCAEHEPLYLHLLLAGITFFSHIYKKK